MKIKKWGEMTEEQYIELRLQNQINWYDKKSAKQKRWFYMLKMVTVSATALIPFFSIGVKAQVVSVWITAALGVIATLSEGGLSLGKFHEKWIQYRSTSEQLKHELNAYITASGVYSAGSAPDNFDQLVTRVENLISNENTNWTMVNKTEEGKK
jgi:hypothetical protein